MEALNLYIWNCNKCEWHGSKLKRYKVKRVGLLKKYVGCPNCKADIKHIEFIRRYKVT